VELTLAAERQVSVFIAIVCRRYGVTEDEIPKLLDGLRWSMEHRQHLTKMSITGILAIVTTLVGALLLVLWEGLQHIIRGSR
jgi:hypothetical protein